MVNKTDLFLPGVSLLLVLNNAWAKDQSVNATLAYEQQKALVDDNAPRENAAAPAPQRDDVVELDAVTVTAEDDGDKLYNARYSSSATRTDTPIKEIPQSIQVITQQLLNDQQNVTISETLHNVSGVVPNNILFTPAAEATKIRGFAAEQLLDGFSQYYNPGDRESVNNLERIEVLKGSNAVLYSGGSGAPVGGVVNLVSKLPKAQAFGQVGTKIGTYDFYQPFVDINQPFSKNALFRFTGEFTDAGSYLENIHTERYNVNPVLTLTDNDKTAFTLQGRIAKWRQKEYQGLPATGTVAGDFKIRPDLFIGPTDIEPSHSDFYGIWGTLDHWINDTWSINLKARYAESEFNEIAQTIVGEGRSYVADKPLFIDPQRGPMWGLANTELFQEQNEKSVLGNILAQFDYGPTQNKVLLGADYSEYDDSGFLQIVGAGKSVNLTLPDPNFPAYLKSWSSDNNLFVKNTTYGGYAQLQSTLYDRLHLLFSVRAGTVEIDYTNTGFSNYNGITSDTRLLPRAGAVFDLTRQFSLFVNYSEGMRGQPFTRFSGKPAPALSESIEAGIKLDVAEQLTGQLAVYQIDRSNVAVASFTDPFGSIPAGTQQSRGFESDLVWRPTQSVNILANYAYTNAEFSNDLAANITEGSKLFGVPEHATRVWANYDFQQPALKGLSIGTGVYWQSETFLSNKNFFKSDSYYTMDASIAYQFQRYKIAATLKNLTDESYFQSYGYLGGRVAPAQGASAVVTLTVNY